MWWGEPSRSSEEINLLFGLVFEEKFLSRWNLARRR
jgi:hypothetical protein